MVDDVGDAIAILGDVVTDGEGITLIPRCPVVTVEVRIGELDGIITHHEINTVHGATDGDTNYLVGLGLIDLGRILLLNQGIGLAFTDARAQRHGRYHAKCYNQFLHMVAAQWQEGPGRPSLGG